jgi:hypothetical protein
MSTIMQSHVVAANDRPVHGRGKGLRQKVQQKQAKLTLA